MKFQKIKNLKKILSIILSILIMISIVPAGIISGMAKTATAEMKTIVILPFEVNSQKDLSFIKSGIVQMLNSRLSWKDHVAVVDGRNITDEKSNSQSLLKSILNKNHELPGVPNKNYNYVLTGSITEFAGAFSIDVKVINTENKTSHSFFIQASSMEKIIPGIDILAAKINKTIFNRTTAALKAMTGHNKKYESKKEKAIRQNPEKLLEEQFGKEIQKSRPFWKFWGKNDNPVIDNTEINDEHQITKDRPFWKFWGKDSNEDDIDKDNTDKNDTNTEEQKPEKKDKPFWKIW